MCYTKHPDANNTSRPTVNSGTQLSGLNILQSYDSCQLSLRTSMSINFQMRHPLFTNNAVKIIMVYSVK